MPMCSKYARSVGYTAELSFVTLRFTITFIIIRHTYNPVANLLLQHSPCLLELALEGFSHTRICTDIPYL